MASSYTTRIRLNKQGDGDNPNSWGTVLNDGALNLIDDAIGAYTPVTIGANAVVTLTANDGVSDTARSAFIEIVGSVGGAHDTITIQIPSSISKSYVINNKVSANTTATDVVKIKNAGVGSGYTVPFGSIGLVITNGTSVFPTNVTGLGFGTAANADIGVCATNVADVSLGDLRYVRTSVTSSIVGANLNIKQGQLIVGTSSRAYNPITTVTDATSIAIDFSKGNNFLVTIGGNRTLELPTNCTAGQTGQIHIIQDGTGSRTLAYNTAWQFVSAAVPTLSTGSSDVDILCYVARSATTIDAVLLKNFDR
tara:strand:- start:12728 stop:13654 length:927 start_codon:yes stop_codon:yes gene_type:complete